MDYFQATVYQIARESLDWDEDLSKELAMSVTLLGEDDMEIARSYKEFAKPQGVKRKRDVSFLVVKEGLDHFETDYSIFSSFGLAVNEVYDFLIVLNFQSDQGEEFKPWDNMVDNIDIHYFCDDVEGCFIYFDAPGDVVGTHDSGSMQIQKTIIDKRFGF